MKSKQFLLLEMHLSAIEAALFQVVVAVSEPPVSHAATLAVAVFAIAAAGYLWAALRTDDEVQS